MRRSEAEDIARSAGWLSVQDEPIRAAILLRARIITLKAGESFFNVEEERNGLFCLLRGSVLVQLPCRDNVLRCCYLGGPVIWFGHPPSWRPSDRRMTTLASEPSVALHLNTRQLGELRSLFPDLEARLTDIPHHIARLSVQTAADLLIRRADLRVMATLARIVHPSETPFGPQAGLATICLSQAQLGEMANVSRNVVNQVLIRLSDLGVIELRYQKITVLQRERLLELSAGEPPAVGVAAKATRPSARRMMAVRAG